MTTEATEHFAQNFWHAGKAGGSEGIDLHLKSSPQLEDLIFGRG